MATTTRTGKEQRFANALLNGKTISTKQATSQYKIANPSATVHRLRTKHGLNIRSTFVFNRSGQVTGAKYYVPTYSW